MDTPRSNGPSEHEQLIEKSRRLREEAERLCAEVRQRIEHLEWTVDAVRRQWVQDYFRPLQDAIRVMHGCESRHLRSYAVRKVLNGQVLWLGTVEEFALDGAAGADTCYAWQYTENGQPRTFSLLRQEPVNSPQAAVQVYLLAKSALPSVVSPAWESA